MPIKVLKYNVLSNDQIIIENKSFSLNVAEKAKYIVHRAVKTAAKNRSQFTSSTKTKSEVRGGGRKPWKQKGTGNARAGSKRSPIWRGGGVTFGPKPKSIYRKINKKEKQLALQTLIYNKQSQLLVFEKLEMELPKTKSFIKDFKISDLEKTTLLISSKPNKNIKLAIQNLKSFEYTLACHLNIQQLAKANQIILDEESFQIIKETYCERI